MATRRNYDSGHLRGHTACQSICQSREAAGTAKRQPQGELLAYIRQTHQRRESHRQQEAPTAPGDDRRNRPHAWRLD